MQAIRLFLVFSNLLATNKLEALQEMIFYIYQKQHNLSKVHNHSVVSPCVRIVVGYDEVGYRVQTCLPTDRLVKFSSPWLPPLSLLTECPNYAFL